MADAKRLAALERLKAQVRTIEDRTDPGAAQRRARRLADRVAPPRGQATSPSGPHRLTLGAPEIDRILGGGLAVGLHELRPESYFDAPAAVAALAGLLARAAAARPGPVLWVRSRGGAIAAHDFGAPDPAGLAALGLDPARVALVDAKDAAGLLWAMEEGASSKGVAAVAGEIGASPTMSRVAARRLQLAAKAAGGFVFALRGPHGHAPSPAVSRWSVAARPGADAPWRGADATPGLGRARLALTLERLSGADFSEHAADGETSQGEGSLLPRTFIVEWTDAADGFRLAAPVADRPARAEGRGRLPLRIRRPAGGADAA
jgi:protein ImuA